MRICVLARGVPDARSPANGLYEWGQATLLKRIGYDVTVIAVDLRLGKDRKKRGLRRATVNGLDVWEYGLPVGAVKKSVARFLRAAVVRRAFATLIGEGKKPDLTWAYFGRTFGGIALKMREEYGVPYVVSEYESRLLSEKVPGGDARKLAAAYKKAAYCFAPNPAFCNRLSMRFCRDFTFLPPTASGGTNTIPHDGFVFLSIGALSVEKGMDTVIRAFARVKKVRDDVRLVIAGRGEEKPALTDLVQALRVEDSVRFLAARTGEELKKLLSASDCFVLASRSEWYGTLYLEAMAAGLPVLTTDCFAPGGLIPAVAGKIVPIGDVMSLSVCMTEACTGKSSFDRDAIRAFASGQYSPEAVGEKIRAFLGKMQTERPADGFSQ